MPLTAIDMTSALPPISFVVPGLFPAGFVSFLGAREGVGKTTILTSLLWQRSRSAGRFLDLPVAHGTSIYVNTDAPDGNSRTVRFWLERHAAQYPDGDLDFITVLEPGDGGLTPHDLKQLAQCACDTAATVIVIDSYMGAFPSSDSNRLDQTMRPMSQLRQLAAVTGAAVIVTDHIPKRGAGERDGDRGIIGSVAKSAQARSVHILTRLEQDSPTGDLVRWTVQKSSFAPRLPPFSFSIEVTDRGDASSGVEIVRTEVLGNGTGRQRAQRAVVERLEKMLGNFVRRRDLLECAMLVGGVKMRVADDAVRDAIGQLGARVQTLHIRARGGPVLYRMVADSDVTPGFDATGTASNPNSSRTPEIGLMQAGIPRRNAYTPPSMRIIA